MDDNQYHTVLHERQDTRLWIVQMQPFFVKQRSYLERNYGKRWITEHSQFQLSASGWFYGLQAASWRMSLFDTSLPVTWPQKARAEARSSRVPESLISTSPNALINDSSIGRI